MRRGHSYEFWTITILNAAAGVSLALVGLESFSEERIPVVDVGAPLGMGILFFVIPLAGAGLWLKRKFAKKPPAVSRPYRTLSKLFLSLTWLVSCLPVYFYLSFFWHYLPRPLLVSQQGPDTSHAVQAYQEYFGYPPPSTVQNIYNQTAPDLVLFRFDYTNAEVVKRTANQFHLKPAPRCHLNLANAPQWWQERNLRESGGCFTDRAGSFQTYSLWVDWERRRVFFKAFRP